MGVVIALIVTRFKKVSVRFWKLAYRNRRVSYKETIVVYLRLLGQYPRATNVYHPSLAIKREIGDRSGEASSLGSLGNAYHSLGQYERAIELYQQSLEIAREIGNRHYEATALFAKALSLAKYERWPFEALDTLQQARVIHTELNLIQEVIDCDEAICAFNQTITTLKRHLSEHAPQLEKAIVAIKQLETADPNSEEFSQALADLHVAATVLEPYSEGIVEAINQFTDDRPE